MEQNTYNKFQKLINFLHKYGLIIISIIIGGIGLFSIFITAHFPYDESYFSGKYEIVSFKYSLGIIEILFTIIVTLLIAVISKKTLKKVSSKVLLLILMIINIVVYICWINILKIPVYGDQKSVSNIADALCSGSSVSLNPGSYLFRYPYQFGISVFISIIYKIFGNNILYVQYVNAFCSIANMIIIFFISKIIFKKESIQKILVILLSVFSIYWMFFNTFVYGNIIGLSLSLLGVLFTTLYLKNKKWYYLIFAGAFISLAIIMKSNYKIFLCGIVVVLILDIIKKSNLKVLAIIPIFLIGYLAINIGGNLITKYKYKVELPEGVPMITYVYMGMAKDEESFPGWYTNDVETLYNANNYDNEKTSENAKQLIKGRIGEFIKKPKECIKYYSLKLASTWLNPTFQTIWTSSPGPRYEYFPEYKEYLEHHKIVLSMISGKIYKAEENVFNVYQIIIFIFGAIGIFKSSKNLDLKKSLIPIIILGGFLFHIIWETKAIYVIQYYFILLPFSAYGIDYTIRKILLYKKALKSS